MQFNIECPFCNGTVLVKEAVFEGEYICPHCKRQFGKIYILAKRDSDLPIAAKLMTIEFRKDIDKLLNLGIKIDKGALVTKAGGILGAGATACSGHWIAALAIGVASLFADTIGDSYKKIKLREFQLKWLSILNQLNNNQRTAFLSMLEVDCPMISAHQLPYLLLPSEE
jgi:DNA-directed RNA polymerase subunit RPC12/RpoP